MQIIKFGLVGLLGTFAHYAILIIGVQLFWASATLASSIGFIIGAFINHHYNRKFTFDSSKPYLKTLTQFMISASGLFVLNLLLMFAMTEIAQIQYLLAQVITTGVVFVSGFIINKFLVFKS